MKILIADDEPHIVTALEFLLEHAGYEVSIARTGDEALAAARTTRPDLVLLDVMMPAKSGYEVCRELRAQPDTAGIKVIMLTAKGAQKNERKGIDSGADLYITKPFSNRELLDRIRGLLAS